MDANRPHYRVYNYYAGHYSSEWTTAVDAPCDAEMIEQAREMMTPEPEITPVYFCWTDLFYCHGREVKLVGTWVIKSGSEGEVVSTWHTGGWSDRPKPSKEKALRYLHELGRPI